jgi:hypothetical protein
MGERVFPAGTGGSVSRGIKGAPANGEVSSPSVVTGHGLLLSATMCAALFGGVGAGGQFLIGRARILFR